jgi:hypothetical protein
MAELAMKEHLVVIGVLLIDEGRVCSFSLEEMYKGGTRPG